MNIFVVAKNPILAAQMLCDQHVVKMPLESVQLMCNVYRQYVPHFVLAETPLYNMTHRTHPCTLWAGASADNYAWLSLHAGELFAEYTRRFGRVHGSFAMFERVRDTPGILQRERGATPFVQCMPDRYRGPNAIDAYRRYYIAEKLNMARWRYTEVPYWIPNGDDYRR